MNNSVLNYIANKPPQAAAHIAGSQEYGNLRGTAEFYDTGKGVLVYTEVYNLPYDSANPYRIFAYHIHEGESCSGNADDPFANALGHYNPRNAPHPYHAGDLPPLFGNYGFAWNIVFTSRFAIGDIIGKTIIIHSKPDDFTTQPSGNSGAKIACGIIEAFNIKGR